MLIVKQMKVTLQASYYDHKSEKRQCIGKFASEKDMKLLMHN